MKAVGILDFATDLQKSRFREDGRSNWDFGHQGRRFRTGPPRAEGGTRLSIWQRPTCYGECPGEKVWSWARQAAMGMDSLAKRTELLEWFYDQSVAARDEFSKYMDFRNREWPPLILGGTL